MPSALYHEPAAIVRRLMIAAGQAGEHTAGGAGWPSKWNDVPSAPDQVVVLTDTAGFYFGRVAPTAAENENYGIQVLVRAAHPATAGRKAREIKAWAAGISNAAVTLDGRDYCVADLPLASGPVPMKEPDSKRPLITLNFLAVITPLY